MCANLTLLMLLLLLPWVHPGKEEWESEMEKGSTNGNKSKKKYFQSSLFRNVINLSHNNHKESLLEASSRFKWNCVYKYAYLPSLCFNSIRYILMLGGWWWWCRERERRTTCGMYVRKFSAMFICEKIILAVNYVISMRVHRQGWLFLIEGGENFTLSSKIRFCE